VALTAAQAAVLGCWPSAPWSWKSLARVAQPLAFSVAGQAPPAAAPAARQPPAAHAGCHIAATPPHCRLTCPTRIALARLGLGDAPLTIQNASSCTEPHGVRGVDSLRSVVANGSEATDYPFARLAPRGFVKRPLGPHQARPACCWRLTPANNCQPEIAPASSCIPRCQRRAPRLHEVIGWLKARRWGLPFHAFDPASAGYPDGCPAAVDNRAVSRRTEPLTPASPTDGPD